ncbi:MAG: hypothetical protein WAU77_11005 [Solirubrobacteraceae bacterium]
MAQVKLGYGLAARCLVAGLIALVFVMSLTSFAAADVDTAGSLLKVPAASESPTGEVKPLFEKASGDYECSTTLAYSDVQNAADSYSIGNCKAPWRIEVVSYSNAVGVESYGGFVTGAFSGCGWIETQYEPKKINNNSNSACGEGTSGDFVVPTTSFMERPNSAKGDGWPVVNTRACPEYANYRPWSSNNVEQELLRTAPAYAAEAPGSRTPALKWRYITKYGSTDGSGQYVMVRDGRYNDGEGNWVFVPRSCLPSTLPENESELIPPPPPPPATSNVFYVGSGGGISDLYVENNEWKTYGLGGSVASGTNPSAVGSGTGRNVFYVGSDGAIWDWYIENGAWKDYRLGGSVAAGTSPSVVGSGNGRNVYYVGSEGQIWDWYIENGMWKDFQIGGSVAAGTSPSAVNESGVPNVFYVGSGGGITDLYVENGAWKTYGLGGSVRAGTNPSAVISANGRNVYYVGSEGQIWDWYVEGVWKDFQIGGSVAAGTSPSAVNESPPNAFYVGSGGGITDLYVENGAWKTYGLGGSVRAGTNPSAVIGPNGRNAYYVGSEGQIWDWYVENGAWRDYQIGGSVASGTSPSALG